MIPVPDSSWNPGTLPSAGGPILSSWKTFLIAGFFVSTAGLRTTSASTNDIASIDCFGVILSCSYVNIVKMDRFS